jgi:diguanylate cyclase (GGDEF)-like protein
VLSTNGLLLTPFERLVRSRRRETFFVVYSSFCIVILSAIVLLDGGIRSPVTVALVLPTLFAALSYPLRSTIAVGALDLVAYVLVCVGTERLDVLHSAVIGGLLGIVAALCAWHAAIHDRQRIELRRLALTDPLTGVLNRRGFEERLDAQRRQSARDGDRFGVLVLDLDDFKAINDRDGHAAGDAALRWAADTTNGVLRPRDALGRVGGDEFAVVLSGADHEAAAAVVTRLTAALAVGAPATIGTAIFPDDASSTDELLRCADRTLYDLKRTAAHTRRIPNPAKSTSRTT